LTCQKGSNSWFVYQIKSIRRWNDFGTLSSCLKVTSNSNGSLPLTRKGFETPNCNLAISFE
jgi:hypothetical protein